MVTELNCGGYKCEFLGRKLSPKKCKPTEGQ